MVAIRLSKNYSFLLITFAGLVAGLISTALGNAEMAVILWAATTLVGFYVSLVSLVRAIKSRDFGSDVLALLAILSAGLIGQWLAAAVISTMLATGMALERWAEGQARRQLESLLARAPNFAHRIDSTGQISDIEISAVTISDRILVRAGEVVPIDGRLITDGTFDESALTGESIPRFRPVGEEVSSGVLNTGSVIEMHAVRDADSSTYSNLIRLVKQAQATSANSVRLANKWAVRFVPFALGIALLAWVITGDVSRAVAVIVAATPCPLILAVPVAIISGMAKAAGNGAIIKGGAALEQLARTSTVLLDKTGTLTHGGAKLSAIAVIPGASENKILAFVASLEQASPHVVAKAIVAEAKSRELELVMPENVVENHGHGLSGLVDGHEVSATQITSELPTWAELDHALQVAIVIDQRLVAVLGIDDPLRSDARQTVSELRELGVSRILLVSGDRKITADKIGAEVGVDETYSECSPQQKLEVLRAEMGSSQGCVVVVGDGINDAPALAAADVGVAMGARGSTAASEAADVVIVEDSIRHLALAIEISKGARRRALQASGIGMGLSCVAMMLGAFGVFNVTAAAFTQELIDALAILWALVPVVYRVKL
jgi:heavy metal translocating P-type ATPase